MLSIISSVIDIILCAVILYNAFKYRNALTTVLGVVQLVGSLAFAAMTLPAAEAVTATPLYLDYMSVIWSSPSALSVALSVSTPWAT